MAVRQSNHDRAATPRPAVAAILYNSAVTIGANPDELDGVTSIVCEALYEVPATVVPDAETRAPVLRSVARTAATVGARIMVLVLYLVGQMELASGF